VRRPAEAGACRSGFTLVEVLITSVILSIVLLGLHRVYLQQRQISGWQRDMAVANDVFRIVGSVLSDDLREAIAGEGDVVLGATDSIRVRSPIGFGYVCYALESGDLVGIEGRTGSLPNAPGDSLHIYATSGWRRSSVVGSLPVNSGPTRCEVSQARPEALLKLRSGGVDDVPVGAPIRSFRSTSYHVSTFDGQPWFSRSDASGTEAIAGPISPRGLRFRALDSGGDETAVPADIVAIEVSVVVPRPATRGAIADTMTMVFQGRNR